MSWLYVPKEFRNARSEDINILSVCSGAGGLDDGLRLAVPSARAVCYVEREAPVVQALVSRMEEGGMDPAPIFSDARAFDGTSWRGRVHGVAGGTSCQDLSLAGRRAGIEGTRSSVFFEFVRIIEEAEPDWLFWENVGGATAALPAVFAEFEALGYHGAWCRIRASDVDASHERARVFVLAHREGVAQREPHHQERAKPRQRAREDAGGGSVRLHEAPLGHLRDAGREECGPLGGDSQEKQPAAQRAGMGLGAQPPGPDDLDLWARVLRAAPYMAPAAPESFVQRVVDGLGLAARQDLLRMLGNGVVPRQAAAAFLLLSRHLSHATPRQDENAA